MMISQINGVIQPYIQDQLSPVEYPEGVPIK